MSRYYNLKTVRSGEKLEVYKYSIPIETSKETNNKTGRKGKGKKVDIEKVEKNRKETLNRARNQIIRLLECNPDMTTFMSFTYANNMQDLPASKQHMSKLIKDLTRRQNGFKMLYVLEYQARGAIHYHACSNFYVGFDTAKKNHKKPEIQKQLENYFHATFWTYGWVDIRNLESEGNTCIGKYVAAYLVEDLYKLDLGGQKCYGYTQNLNRPVEQRILSPMQISQIPEYFPDYQCRYSDSYQMRYETDYGNVCNNVSYFDLKERAYESKSCQCADRQQRNKRNERPY